MFVWIKFVVKSIILPPGIFFLLAALGVILTLRKEKKWQGCLLVFASFFGLFLLSSPQIAYWLTCPLEEKITTINKNIDAQAIVILGGGQRYKASEYNDQDVVSTSSLIRIAYGAYLHRKTALPILLSGGKLMEDKVPEAKVMESSLQDMFSVSAKWTEEKSQSTAENAKYTAEILKSAGIKKILLVTEAWHMRRALLAFSSTGLEVIAAPTNFQSFPHEHAFLDWLPQAKALLKSMEALHEWIGYIWYRISIP